ncbi:Rv0518 family GDSL lipase [Mycolicibacterium septicum]|uniref:SGNH/GDSL hydrolase family protein n=1 Tax=Mycolicibacterium septicum DSM 44393 TaxID=1341646 RepID=A0A7X6RV27_9MYCO|nr:GDSL lipase [Mycolicibacterium septicum]NKZ10165.1 SGNH/GDSL hydrolase family protein [Mycolicibacterium septicum DSM 44393]QRY50000.1 SGNH/GDSL hydrolase family protein [Mycolicibacterium septicum]
MSRLTAFIVSLALLVGLFAQAPERRYVTSGLDPQINHIAVIGDSYTTGMVAEGGMGPRNWAPLAWQELAQRGVQVDADVVAEGGAGYEARGNRGSVFADLTSRAVQPDDALIVFFGSRNDKDSDLGAVTRLSHDALTTARQSAPAARMLVIGPPWVSPDVPPNLLGVRDILRDQARQVGATFVDPIAERWFFDRPELIGADGIHPTDAGHAYMADKIAPLIGKELPRWV